LIDTTSKEKEVMGQIFDREFRREKNLEIAKKLANDAVKAQATKKGKKDPVKEAAEKKAKEEAKLVQIEETFF